MAPLSVIPPPINFIKISYSSDSRSSDDDNDEYRGPQGDEDLEGLVEEHEGANPFRFYIRDVGRFFAFPEVLVVNLDTIGEY